MVDGNQQEMVDVSSHCVRCNGLNKGYISRSEHTASMVQGSLKAMCIPDDLASAHLHGNDNGHGWSHEKKDK